MSILESIRTSLIDKDIDSGREYRHTLLSNGKEKIISKLREEFENCDEFVISVAFITEGGVTLLLETLKKLEKRGVKGYILTGDYQNFTQPKALKRILEFSNIDLRLLRGKSFHAKGYFFKKGDKWNIIIGSSNLTASALTTNFEWNLKISSMETGEIVNSVLKEFYRSYDSLKRLDLKELEEYTTIYNRYQELIQKSGNFDDREQITPNLMQRAAIENLEKLRERGANKGLLISATGTGKTYLSGFDVQKVKPKRMLFLAHRRTILERAKQTYKTLIRNKKIGIYDGELNCDYIFAMVQTLNKEEHLTKFKRDYFDYIVIDEVHHSGAKTYQKILNYFKPKFLLGMTATPERTDNFDIFKVFDYNIAYEIRLHQALEEQILCPFHYFGVVDIDVDGVLIDEKTTVNHLIMDERVEHVLEKSRFYGYSGERCHGLIFVSKIEEGKILAEKLSDRGAKAVFLSSEDNDEIRENTIKSFERGEIEYILTVDIFNEGVDIPCINQVIMLRPTSSSIVYIQQLGRGLRHHQGKEFLVIIDFIGNYEKNFLIPIAISQDNSYNKDNMRRFLQNGTDLIPGESSITFEEIAKERIIKNIGESSFSTKKNIERDFKYLEKKLGRIPYLCDFFINNMIEPAVILEYKKSYDEIIELFYPEKRKIISKEEREYLRFLSTIFTPAKRVHEMIVLEECIENGEFSIERIENRLSKQYNLQNQSENILNAVKHLAKEIFTSYSVVKKYPAILEKIDGNYILDRKFREFFEKNDYFRNLVLDIISYNLKFCGKYYPQQTEKTIILHKEYTKEEGFWYLNLDYNNGYQVSGYTLIDESRVGCLFITIDNSFDIYDNRIKNRDTIKWFSKSNRYLKRDGKLTKEGRVAENFYTLHLFAKKKNGENFYYLGEIEKVIDFEEIKDKQGISVVMYDLKLKNVVDSGLYRYLWGE